MKKRIHLKPKIKLKTKLSARLVIIVSGFALLIGTGFFLYYNFGVSTNSIASNQNELNTYGWRKRISFDKDIVKGKSELRNFPLLINITDADLRSILKGGKVINPKGADIQFTKSDGKTIFPSQIENYNSNTGELTIWVLIDTLKPNFQQELLMYYSSATAKSTNGEIAWNAGFKGVWHLNETLNAANSRTIRALASGTSEVKGKIANAREFNSESKDYASFDYNESLNTASNFTISAWVQLKESGREQVIISNQGDQPGGYRMFIGKDNQLSVDFLSAAGERTTFKTSGELLQLNRWYHVAAVYSEKENKLTTFVDGIEDRSVTTNIKPSLTASSLQIGRDLFEKYSYFNGIIDELKFSSEERTQDWLATEFYTQIGTHSLLRLWVAEELKLNANSLQLNKEEINAIEANRSKELEQSNVLKAKKLQEGISAPLTVTTSAEAMNARLNKIRSVNEKNRN